MPAEGGRGSGEHVTSHAAEIDAPTNSKGLDVNLEGGWGAVNDRFGADNVLAGGDGGAPPPGGEALDGGGPDEVVAIRTREGYLGVEVSDALGLELETFRSDDLWAFDLKILDLVSKGVRYLFLAHVFDLDPHGVPLAVGGRAGVGAGVVDSCVINR